MEMGAVEHRLRSAGRLDEAGGQTYLIELSESYAEWANAGFYAKQVRDCYQRRCCLEIADQIKQSSYNSLDQSPSELCATHAAALERVSLGTKSDNVVEAGKAIGELPAYWARTVAGQITTGVRRFDEETGGLERPSLVLLAARPSNGKTSLALRIALAAGETGTASLFISVETVTRKIAERLVSMLGGRSVRQLRDNASTEDREAVVQFTKGRVPTQKLFVVDHARGIREICAVARSMVRRKGIGLIIIDHIQLIRPDGRYENRNLEVASISDALHHLAKQTGACVLALSQLNRAGGEAAPTLRSLRDSGALEQDADAVIFLHRYEGFRDPVTAKVQLIVAKNRDGPTFDQWYDFHKPTMSFVPTVCIETRSDEIEKGPWDD